MLSCEQTSLDLAVDMLVMIVRKQPTWLHRVAQHPLLRELLRLLRQEGELVVLVPAILVLALCSVIATVIATVVILHRAGRLDRLL